MKFNQFVENKKYSLLFILLISLLTRIIYFVHFRENPFFSFINEASDSINFDVGAQSFAAGDLLATSANNSYSPLYKYFIGFIYLLAGRNLPVVWGVQFAMGVCTILLVFLITSKLFNNRAAFISSILYAFYGPELMHEGILLRESFIAFLGVLSLYLLINLEEKNTFPAIIVTGFVISLFIQARPNVILVFALLPFILFYCSDKKNIRKVAGVSFVVLLFFLPLLIQAYIVHGKFVFFDSSGKTMILMGNNPAYPGADYLPQFRYPGDSSLSYTEIISILLTNLVSHPLGMVTLYLRKFYYFFNFYEVPSNNNFYVFREFSFLLKTPLSNFAVFSSLGLMGFLMNINKFKKLPLLNAYFIGMTLSVVLFYIVSRFRIPVVPYYAIFAGCFLDRICGWFTFKEYKKLFVSITMAICFLFFFNISTKINNIDNSLEYGNLGNVYLNINNVEKAIAAFNKSLEINPNNPDSRNNLGNVYANQGQFSKAAGELTKAIKLYPDKWEPLYNLGLVYMESGQFKEAEEALLSAQILAPRIAQIPLSLGNLYENTGSFEQSLKFYKIYTLLAVEDWKGYFLLGNTLSRLNRFGAAIEEYGKSKKLNSEHSQTLVNLGNSYSYIDKPNLALEEYLAALSLNINDPDIHHNIGVLYVRKDFFDPLKAVYYLQKSLELDPKQDAAESIKKLINQLKES